MIKGPGPRSWVALSVIVLFLVLAPQAISQAPSWGFYYKEIRKDDRIFVFNSPAEADRFETTGAMSRSIERPGAGPEGQTVVGDSERALQLFFFKYGLSVPVLDPLTPRVDWNGGKTRVTTALAHLELSNRIQVRYTHKFPDESPVPGILPGSGEGQTFLALQRLKTKLEGWMWLPPKPEPALPKITYELQFNWPGINGTNLRQFIEDASMAIDPTGYDKFRVRMGQFKVPFGRQFLTSSGNQSFVDRSLVSNAFSLGRATGVAVEGVLANKVEYRASVFNGVSQTPATNADATFLAAARLMWQPNGNQRMAQPVWVGGALYSEADFESKETPIYAFAVNVESNAQGTAATNGRESRAAGVDGIFKYKGVFATAEYFWRRQTPEVGGSFRSRGGYGELTFMLNRLRTWEVGFRYGLQDNNESIGNDDVQEIRGEASYYYRRHALQFQFDAGQIRTGLTGGNGHANDFEVRLQTQFVF